ncbi:MAG: polysaccharide biosynthesis C-terminal domain-containing protein, partial [Candidatus Dormibacteraeota bacterium]|nr:polysaccharide biosynthesis C-terminal domain-containing protein [Candidatus Dormibacteraeota bacterium]
VGWYNVPTKLFSTLLVVPSILSVAFFPRLSRAFRAGVTGLTAEARPALEIVLILSLPVAVGTALVARQLIWVLYGAPFLPAAPVLSILALCLPPTYLNMMANQVLIAANRQIVWTKVMVAAAVFNPLLNLELIRAGQSLWGNGALGAALALLGTELGMAGAALVLMPRVLNRGSWLRLLRAAAATAGMAATVWFVSHRGLAVQVGAGVLVFAALGALFRVLTRGELTQLLHLAGRLRR